MWPFKRRRNADGSIDLDDLVLFQEKRPAVCYVNYLMLVLARHMGREVVLRSSQPLPALLNNEPHEIPSFAEAANRLKIMCNLDPVRYPHAKEGEIRLRVGCNTVVIHVCFDDTTEDPTVQLRMERDSSMRLAP